MHRLWLLAIIGLFGVDLAEVNLGQIVTHLPSCTITCSAKLLAAANCPLTDMQNCLCTNTTLQNELFDCVNLSCNITEQYVSAKISQQICAGVPQPSRATEIIRTVTIISAFAFSIIILRLFSRYTLAKLAWDDWVIVASAIFMIPMTVIPIWNALRGFGTHSWDVPPENAVLLRQLYYVSQILYVVVQNLAKISILLLYLRIFPGVPLRLATKLVMAWISLRAFAYLIAVSLQCVPVDALWDLAKPAKCVNATQMAYTGAAFSIFEDVVIIILPIPELYALNLTWRKRAALIFIFALGSFACITSMVRLKFIAQYNLNSMDATWSNVDVILWSIIEVYSAVICACLMSIRPLLVKYFPSLFPTTTTSSQYNQYPNQNSYHHHNASWRPRESSSFKFWKGGNGARNQSVVELTSKETVGGGSASKSEDEERGRLRSRGSMSTVTAGEGSGKDHEQEAVKITREFTVSVANV